MVREIAYYPVNEPRERRRVAEALLDVSEITVGPSDKISRASTPFLVGGRLYSFGRAGGAHPLAAKLWMPKVGEPQAVPYDFAGATSIFAAVPQDIENEREAIDYAVFLTYMGRERRELLHVIEAVEDIRFAPNLRPEEIPERDRIVSAYTSVITLPKVVATEGGYTVELFVHRQTCLERHTLRVNRDGCAEREITDIESGMPTIYGH